jgi:hypothetical protein
MKEKEGATMPQKKGPSTTTSSADVGQTSPQVSAWFERLEHPLKDAMIEVRDTILAADPRIQESVKWSTPTFSYNGDLASLQPKAKKFASLMFHRGSEIPGDHAGLVGTSALVRTMKFTNLSDVKRRRKELEDIVRAWCTWKETGK